MDIFDILRQKNIVDEKRLKLLQESQKSSGKTPEEVLLKEGVVDEEILFNLKSEALGIPLSFLETKDIPLKVLERIPEDSAKYYHMIPLKEKQGTIEIGMVYPEDPKAYEALKFLARQGNFSFRISLIVPSTFEQVMRNYRKLTEEVTGALQELQEEMKDEVKKKESEPRRFVEEAPIIKVVAVILRNAVDGKASDVHIEPTKDNLRVRFRLMGELYSSLLLPKKVHQAVITRIKILANLKIDESRIPQDGRFSAMINDKSVDFRVSTFPTVLGEKVAIRVLDPEIGIKSLQELGLGGSGGEKIKEALKKPFGLILVTGPTGSGKTTTLYALLQTLNKEASNIVSLEDPVEYLIAGVNQSQIRPEINYDFSQGLRQVLRQDPDIIMVGEVRDKETASLVIHAALTGHIVLSTLHTNNAIGVVIRLVDMEVDKYLIPPTLSVAVSQRLVRRLCDECKERKKPSKEMRELILRDLEGIDSKKEKGVEFHIAKQGEDLTVFEAKGCRKCSNSGFVGRIGIFEVLVMTEEFAAIILEGASEPLIAKEAKRQGMVTLRQDGILKVIDGITTIEEIFRVTEK